MTATSLSTENATPLERALEILTQRLDMLDVPGGRVWNPATCPEAVLPWLAFGLSIDNWRPEWDASKRRAVIAASLPVHRRKGTPGAVRAGAQAISGAAVIDLVEWFEPTGSGQPYTARLEADLTNADLVHDARPDLPRDLASIVRAAGNVRSHVDIRLTARPAGGEHIASRLRTPVSRGRLSGPAPMVRALLGGFTAAANIKRPIARGRLAGSVQLLRNLSGVGCAAGRFRTPAIAVNLTVSGA